MVAVNPVEDALPRVVCPVTLSLDAVVVAKVVVPVTTKVLEVVALVIVAFVIVAFVVVELPMTRSVMLARVATRLEKNPLVEVLFVAKKLVDVAFVVMISVKVLTPAND